MARTNIVCRRCGHKEEVTKRLFFKILGGAVTGFGGWAWVAYLFAGTGFAFAICVTIVAGGVAMAAYSDELAEWFSKKYPCSSCGSQEWKVVTEE